MYKFSTTIMFKEIFPTQFDWDNFMLENGITQSEFINFLYKHLYNKYCNSNINYDTVDAFKRHFIITFENEYKRFEVRKKLIDKQYNLTEDDIIVLNKTINNLALNDNSQVEQPLDEIIKYISQQTSAKMTGNIFDAYINAIDNLRDNFIEDFLDKFKKHFMFVAFNREFIYNIEDDKPIHSLKEIIGGKNENIRQ